MNTRIVETIEYGDFFCGACLVDKPIGEQSLDPRYCWGCYSFLLREAETLSGNKRPKWIPRAQSQKDSTGENGSQKAIQISQDVVLNMSTLDDPNIEVDIIQPPVACKTVLRRGPKHRQLPEDLIRQLADTGKGSKAIAARLKTEHGIEVSYKTIQRILSGQRKEL